MFTYHFKATWQEFQKQCNGFNDEFLRNLVLTKSPIAALEIFEHKVMHVWPPVHV